jgi:hypothetical protein
MTPNEEFFNMERSHAKTQICMMKLLMMAVVVLTTIKGFSQVEGTTVSMVSMSALAYQDMEQDVFSSLNIISSAANIKKIQAGIYFENRFMAKGIVKGQCALSLPLKKAGIGIAADYEGFHKMNFIGVSGGYGMKITDKINVGLKLETGRIKFPLQNNKFLIGYQAGFIFKVNEKTTLGVHLTKRHSPSLYKSVNHTGFYMINAGIGHIINENVFISCEIIKVKNTSAFISPYVNWNIGEFFHLQFGLLQPLNNGYIGLGWKTTKGNIRLSFASHSHLGLSESISLINDFN